MRTITLLTAILVSLAIGGCLSPVEVQEPRETFFGFTSAGLEERHETTDSFPVQWTWEDYAIGNVPNTWNSGSFQGPAWVTQATLTITYDLTNVAMPQADVRPFSRPPLTSWFGVETFDGTSIISHEFGAGPAATASDSVTMEWPIELPPGGLYVGDGDALVVHVGTYYAHEDGVYLDGAESRLDVHLEPAPHLTGVRTGGSDSVQVNGAVCFARDPTGLLDDMILEQGIQTVTFEVPEGTDFLQVRAASGFGDADFWLEDPAGETVIHALGSGSQEMVLLGPDNLQGRTGTWTIHAYPCSQTDGTIALEWSLWDAPNQA